MPTKSVQPYDLFFDANTDRVLRLRAERFGDRFNYTGVTTEVPPDFTGHVHNLRLIGFDYESEPAPATPPALYEERYVHLGGSIVEALPDLALVTPGDYLTPMPLEEQYHSTLFKRLRVVSSVPCTVVLEILGDVVEVP